ncbi:MAG: HlyD family efflux transporter periplasmic adaptor subunit [Pseudomonadales bacterium]|nr:HlyD family efflux transporter periplasmic adaptor subunit [Pseudomonadales bacterium]
MSDLFRKEVLEFQSQRLNGTILLAQPISMLLTVVSLTLIICLIILFLFIAHYTRKETVQGYLRPDKGMLRVYSNRVGSVQNIFVSEGDTIHKGMPLLRIVTNRRMASGSDMSERIINEIQSQIRLLNEESKQHLIMHTQAKTRINQRMKSLGQSERSIKAQISIQKTKLTLLEQQQTQYSKIYTRGHISALALQQKQATVLSLKQEVLSLEAVLLKAQDEQQQLSFEANHLPEQYKLKIRDVQHRKSEFSRRLVEAQDAYRYEVTAEYPGTVSAVEVLEDQAVTTLQPLLKIMPTNAKLVAELLLPTRAAGFVQPGHITRMRFDAFPHQRFGSIDGTIIQVNKAVFIPGEATLPVHTQEPVYRLLASLEQHSINAYGKNFQLKSGMLLETDIILDKRTLMQWILDPFYNLSGNLH